MAGPKALVHHAAGSPVIARGVDDRADAVVVRLRDLASGGVVVHGGTLRLFGEPLFAEEEAVVTMAAERRRREFRAGRIYARRALRQLGVSDAPLLPGQTRAPVWPLGTTGSITHTRTLCAAAVSRTEEIASIGIDIEDFASLCLDLTALVATPAELRQRAEVETMLNLDFGKLLFVIKEATYKVYSPLTRVFLDYSDVEVNVDVTRYQFTSSLIVNSKPAAAGARTIYGRFAIDGDYVLAYGELPVPLT